MRHTICGNQKLWTVVIIYINMPYEITTVTKGEKYILKSKIFSDDMLYISLL